MSDLSSDGLPSEEDLDALAEEQRVVEATAYKVNNSEGKCISCGLPATRICSHCGQEYCSQHVCITHEIQVNEEPLTDEDGTTHQGRRVRLIGEGWPTSLEMIRSLNDEQLEHKISEWQALLKEAVKTGEFFRITVAAAEFEKESRYRSKVRKLQRRREELEKQGPLRLNSKTHRVNAKAATPLSMAESLAKQMNISLDQARALLIVLGAQKKI